MHLKFIPAEVAEARNVGGKRGEKNKKLIYFIMDPNIAHSGAFGNFYAPLRAGILCFELLFNALPFCIFSRGALFRYFEVAYKIRRVIRFQIASRL